MLTKNLRMKPRYTGASFGEVKEYLARQDTTGSAPLAEIVATDEAGRRVVAEAVIRNRETEKARRVAEQARRQAVIDAREAEKARYRAAVGKAARTAQQLAEGCRELATQTGLRWPLRVPASRFHALSWGTVSEKILTNLRWAPFDSRAYVNAYEAILGQYCGIIPPCIGRQR